MAVQTADALEYQIDRRQIGDEEVGVDIDGLFDDLGRDKQGSGRSVGVLLAEQARPFGFPFITFVLREAGVQEADVVRGGLFRE